jgi:NAD-dependent SIR2 family protein deacetylase
MSADDKNWLFSVIPQCMQATQIFKYWRNDTLNFGEMRKPFAEGLKNSRNNKRLIIVEGTNGFVHGLFTYGEIQFYD